MKFTLHIVAAVLVAFALAPSARAQSARDVEREANDRDIERRSWNLKLLSLSARPAHDKPRQVEQAVAQLQEDFTRLQIVNKDLLRTVLGGNAIDLKFVKKSVSEIKKRAERLNDNLKLPEPEGAAVSLNLDAVTSAPQLKPSLLKLGRLIFSFVDNPFFKEISVVDTQLTAKARRDLEDIVELSEQIKKRSEWLEKTRGQR